MCFCTFVSHITLLILRIYIFHIFCLLLICFSLFYFSTSFLKLLKISYIIRTCKLTAYVSVLLLFFSTLGYCWYIIAPMHSLRVIAFRDLSMERPYEFISEIVLSSFSHFFVPRFCWNNRRLDGSSIVLIRSHIHIRYPIKLFFLSILLWISRLTV